MSDPIKVQAGYLEQLLMAEQPDEKELLKYFDLQSGSPFDHELKLKDEVEVISDKSETLGFGVLDMLNWQSRKKRLRRYRDFVDQYPNQPKIVSEGDSWFQHPLVEDIIDHLLNYYPVFSLGAGGDTLRNIHKKPEFIKAINEIQPKVLLLSGGGNDILGAQFYHFLQDYSNGETPGENVARFLSDSFFDEIEKLKVIYDDIFASLTSEYSELHIITHGYDNIIPNNPNVPSKWYQSKNKSWLGSPMEKRNIKHAKDKQQVIIYILSLFNQRLSEIADQYDKVHYIDLRGTVKSHQWHDEIHPNHEGYQDLALIFKKKIREILALT